MQLQGMRAQVLDLDLDDGLPILDRLRAIGAPGRRVQTDVISPLEHDSSDLVYVLPFAAIEEDNWPQFRTQLFHSNRRFILVGEWESVSSSEIVQGMRDGAHDFITFEDPDSRWMSALQAASHSQALWLELYGGVPVDSDQSLIGRSKVMRDLRQLIQKVGPSDATVLVTGESGVGKEQVAKALHQSSGRKEFVCINCAAIPKDLMEAELFGAEKGAYTGATSRRTGLIRKAHRGTLFLDEIGEMESGLQPKLLRFLETRRFRPVGSEEETEVDVRIVSATNRDLELECHKGNFRSDLYYRLSELIVEIRPLRERSEDIPLLADHFLQLANIRFGKNVELIEPELVEIMKSQSWAGNVRELKSQIDKLVLLNEGPTLRAHSFTPQRVPQTYAAPAPGPVEMAAPMAVPMPGADPQAGATRLPSSKAKMEMARQMLQQQNMGLAEISAALGIHPTTLYRWRKSGKI